MEGNLLEEKTKQSDTNEDNSVDQEEQNTRKSKHSKKHKSKHSKKHKHKHKKRKHKRKSSSRSRSRSSSRSRSKSPSNSDDDDDSKLDTCCFQNDDLESFKLSKSLPGSPAVVSENKEEEERAIPSSHFDTESSMRNTKDGSESPPFYTEQELLERDGKIPLAKSPTVEDVLEDKLNEKLHSEATLSTENPGENNLPSSNEMLEQSSAVIEANDKIVKDGLVDDTKSNQKSKSKSTSPKSFKRKSTSHSKSRSKSPKSKRSRKSHSRSSSSDKERSRKKSRSRSLSSRSRSRSPKKKNQNRSQDKRRSRSKDRRRSRSKSRDRKRSRSRDRRRSKSKDRRSRSRDRRRSRTPVRNRKSYHASPRRSDSSYNRRDGRRYSDRRSRSPSPRRWSSRRSRSRSPRGKYRGRSRSPRGRGYRRRSRSRSKSRSRRSRSRSYSSRRRKSRSRTRSRERSKRRSRSKSTEPNNDKKDNNNTEKTTITPTTTSAKDLVGKAPTVSDPTNKKSLEMLTEFCKKLTEARGITESEEKAGNENESKEEEEEEDVVISHPFLVAPKKDITIPQVIFPVKPILPPINMIDSTKPLTEQFPVSCGTKHHEKEGDETAVTTVTNIDSSALSVASVSVAPQPVFQQPQEKLDIASLVVKRMDAQRKLKTNPSDIDAMLALQEIEHKLNTWCQSNVKPGQFTGHMAKQMMPKEKINTGYQAWAKKDLFHNLKPVTGGIGMKLLQKMGWEPGQVIGKSGKGLMEPIALTVKVDRKGLSSTFEKPVGKKGGMIPVPTIQTTNQATVDLQGKHPISMLQELCARKRWNPPDFTLIFDEGPPHSKQFLFKVLVNGYEYQNPVVSSNKKHAKAQAAIAALKGLGLVPPNAQF